MVRGLWALEGMGTRPNCSGPAGPGSDPQAVLSGDESCSGHEDPQLCSAGDDSAPPGLHGGEAATPALIPLLSLLSFLGVC